MEKIIALVQHIYKNGGKGALYTHYTTIDWLARNIQDEYRYDHTMIVYSVEYTDRVDGYCGIAGDLFDAYHKIGKYKQNRRRKDVDST